MELFAEAGVIIGVDGSAFSNLLFAPENAQAVIMMPPNTFRWEFISLANIAGVRVHTYNMHGTEIADCNDSDFDQKGQTTLLKSYEEKNIAMKVEGWPEAFPWDSLRQLSGNAYRATNQRYIYYRCSFKLEISEVLLRFRAAFRDAFVNV